MKYSNECFTIVLYFNIKKPKFTILNNIKIWSFFNWSSSSPAVPTVRNTIPSVGGYSDCKWFVIIGCGSAFLLVVFSYFSLYKIGYVLS